jgi:hypothetical protein
MANHTRVELNLPFVIHQPPELRETLLRLAEQMVQRLRHHAELCVKSSRDQVSTDAKPEPFSPGCDGTEKYRADPPDREAHRVWDS